LFGFFGFFMIDRMPQKMPVTFVAVDVKWNDEWNTDVLGYLREGPAAYSSPIDIKDKYN
jgi:hypothetical protein